MKEQVHKNIILNKNRLENWFEEKSQGLAFPIYSSVDIRDGGHKLASVDANIFPAGFNNICPVDQEHDVGLFAQYLEKTYGCKQRKILLLAEDHSSNGYYWENIWTLSHLLTKAGATVQAAVLKPFSGVFDMKTPSGKSVSVVSAARSGSGFDLASGFVPDLVISNNDFSNPSSQWKAGLELPINPAHELGWHARSKATHFEYYNDLVGEFASTIDINPNVFRLETQLVEIDYGDVASLESMAQKAQVIIDHLSKQYRSEHRECCHPVLFVKSNRGTYGMGITTISSGEDLLRLSRKQIKRLGYGKGGHVTDQVILQEAVPTQLSVEGESAEPVIYLVGDQLAGGFLRSHGSKGRTENLNSPGAVYSRLCVSDLMVDMEGRAHENVYGWLAKVNLLAIGLESQKAGVKYGSSIGLTA